ncbi:ATP-binding protein [Blastopirellula sp. J2-11]|uniref:ATP-binding protein n=1 Tax=Blastopirellula sp. J2-11 TaxID=2943192 RepID=UPI0021C809DF|nr:ATP-binding protein [Blastopirellula sp. J2-11]UUO05324.1 ATP-binding protein [Blastopirellula sp. J2-11]
MESLKKSQLLKLGKESGLAGLGAKKKEEVVEILATRRSLSTRHVLGSLRLDELKALCIELNVPVTDRRKIAYVDALLRTPSKSDRQIKNSTVKRKKTSRSSESKGRSSKTLSTIRRGIRYQDLVAAESLLEMLTDDVSPPLWIMLENRAGGTFDDVVIGYPNQVVWKQVKWSQNPGSEPLTIHTLAKQSRQRQTALISSFAESYRRITKDGTSFELEIVTNRSLDSEFQRFVSGTRSTIKSTLSKKQIQQLETSWQPLSGFSKDEFWRFLRSLRFKVNSPDLSRRESEIKRTVRLLGRDQDAYYRLIEAISEWSQDKKKQRIVRTDVEGVLGATTSFPSNDFDMPDKRVRRDESQRELSRRIESMANGYVLVLGAPGSGKSTLLNTFCDEQSWRKNYDVVLYNCFTGTSDQFLRIRTRADNFGRFLSRALYELFQGQFGLRFDAEKAGIESLVNRAASCLKPGRKLAIIIDGIDYAQSFASDGAQSLFNNLPVNLPPGIVFVLSARVLDQMPTHARRNCHGEPIEIPPLDLNQVADLLAQYGVTQNASLRDHQVASLCYTVRAKSSGHALHTSMVVKQLVAGIREGITPETVLEEVASYDGDIEKYYAMVLEAPRRALAKEALGILASSPFELTSREIAQILDPPADPRDVEDQLQGCAHLFRRIGEFWYFSHDSLRSFALSHSSIERFNKERQFQFLIELQNDPRTGEHLLHLLAEIDYDQGVQADVDCEWLVRQIAAGASTSLLHEGCQKLALAALEKQDWDGLAKYWMLKGCLERAEFDGDLYESHLVDAWLSQNRVDLVERYVYVASQFLSSVYPGPDVIELLDSHGHAELSSRLKDRSLSQSIPNVDNLGPNVEFEYFIRHLASRATPDEVIDTIEEALQDSETSDDDFLSSHLDPSRYTSLAAYECLDSEDYARVDSWLQQRPCSFDQATMADLWLRTRISLGELGEHAAKARKLFRYITDREILLAVISIPELRQSVAKRFAELPLPASLSARYPWYEYGNSYAEICDLYNDVRLCNQLSMESRLFEIDSLIRRQPSGVAQAFQAGIVAMAPESPEQPLDWRASMAVLCDRIHALASNNQRGSVVNPASFYVSGLGEIVRPALLQAKQEHQLLEFENVVQRELLPALKSARIQYRSGTLSLCDLFWDAKCCEALNRRLLENVEDGLMDSWDFKSGSLIGLSARYGKLGDLNSSRRVLTAGVRASFTYGYRKDTAINDFIVAFEQVGALLGTRLSKVAEFITQLLLILDHLTDGAMLYDTPGHFVAVLCKFDIRLAAHHGQILQKRCRQLKLYNFAMALRDHGLNVTDIQPFFEDEAPDVEFEKVDGDSRAHFVTSQSKPYRNVGDLKSALSEMISSSSFGSAFHKLPNLVSSLVNFGNTEAALRVFERLEHGLRARVAMYPLPDLGQSEEE